MLGLFCSLPMYQARLFQDNLSKIELSRIPAEALVEINYETATGFSNDVPAAVLEARMMLIKNIVCEQMHIFGKESLLDVMRQAADGSAFTRQFAQLFYKWQSYVEHNEVELKSGDDFVSQFLLNNLKVLVRGDFRAYEISRALLACRLCLYIDWITWEEAMQEIAALVELMRKSYSSYADFYLEAAMLIAFCDRRMTVGDAIYADIRAATVLLNVCW